MIKDKSVINELMKLAHKHIQKKQKFPLEIPVIINNTKLGNVKIDFEQTILESDFSKKELNKYINWIKRELVEFSPIISENLSITMIMESYVRQDFDAFDYSLFCQAYDYRERGPEDVHLARWYEILKKDNEFLEIIETMGPISLCNSGIQYKVCEWLSDKKSFGSKLNKLRDSLRKYAYGHKLLPAGAPKKDMLEKIGGGGIKEMYGDITYILRNAKRIGKKCHSISTYELIDHAGRDFYLNLVNKLKYPISKNRIGSEEEIKQIYKAFMFSQMLQTKLNYPEGKFFSFISKGIEEDNFLRDYFKSLNWQPHEFAMIIMAKLLMTKPETVRSILHRKKKSF